MATPEVNRIYSTDNKLWVGMTVNDAYKDRETLDLFLFADKNKDKKIDELEMERYNSPILVENKKTKVGRFIGHTGIKRTSGETAGEIIQDNEREYYAGLKLEHVDEPDAIQRFQELDIAPKDKVLSRNEIELAMLEKEHADELNKYNQRTSFMGETSRLVMSALLPTISGVILEVCTCTKIPCVTDKGAFIGLACGIVIDILSAIADRRQMSEKNARYEQERQRLMAQND